MSGTAADISLVHWRQQWLENGTLYFHVSMSSSGQLAQATTPTLQEPSEIVEEQMHILHISVMLDAPPAQRASPGSSPEAACGDASFGHCSEEAALDSSHFYKNLPNFVE
ncbi:Astrotactin-2 [Myotis brandtii]|uniref:Astrotactin-2 n=1 Tax=Myotis brandtii TaxID=109478 RepID=S7NHJ8_MYOBR|nr:Astrotactin-2 [Myotis brandtii]